MNEYRVVASDYLKQIDTRYPNTIIHEHIVMPNHIHGIIEIVNANPFVGAIHESPLQRNTNPELYRKHRRKMLIPKIIGWYKMNTAKHRAPKSGNGVIMITSFEMKNRCFTSGNTSKIIR
jgi:hypothetical protein